MDVNRYTAVTAPTSPPNGAWSYGLRGDLSSDGTQRHKWDLENRLLLSNRPGTKKVEYSYDSRSRRTTRTQNGNTTYYIYEGWNVIAEYQGSAGVPPSSTKRHIWGTDLTESMQGAGGVGGLLRTDFATSTTAYFHYDGNGNVTELSNKKGRRSARYRYDAFGNTIVARGKQSEANQYRFSTKPLDEANGFYYYGYRFYDPVSGRWPSRDPIEESGGINLYGIVRNDGANWIDYLGLDPMGPIQVPAHQGSNCAGFTAFPENVIGGGTAQFEPSPENMTNPGYNDDGTPYNDDGTPGAGCRKVTSADDCRNEAPDCERHVIVFIPFIDDWGGESPPNYHTVGQIRCGGGYMHQTGENGDIRGPVPDPEAAAEAYLQAIGENRRPIQEHYCCPNGQ